MIVLSIFLKTSSPPLPNDYRWWNMISSNLELLSIFLKISSPPLPNLSLNKLTKLTHWNKYECTLVNFSHRARNSRRIHSVWKDKNKMTTILGIHLILLGLGAFLVVFKALYFGGLYDTRAPEGGNVRKITNPTISQ